MTRRQQLVELDRRLLWHPFTQMQEYVSHEPIVVARGAGNYIIDVDGRRYIDGASSLWCNVFGHRKAEIDRALRQQMGRIAHSTLLGITNAPSIELAEKLISITPRPLTRVFYSDNGSTAVEVALKMAYQYWQQAERRRYASRTRFLRIGGGYHGDTVGAVSLGGIDLFHSLYRPLLFKTISSPAPDCGRCPYGLDRTTCDLECAARLEKTIARNQQRIAAVVMEPLVQGAAGVIVHPPGFLRRVRDACAKQGVFLILDEVATGFGRTGRMFACEHEAVDPDFLCLSKGLTGGYMPMAATLATERVYDAFLGEYDRFKTFFHGHTYTGNPLAASAAIATLGLFERERVIERLEKKTIPKFRDAVTSLADLERVGSIRQIGLMAGIDLVRNRAKRSAFPIKSRTGYRVCIEARRFGVFIRPIGDTVLLVPPLSITPRQIDDLVGALRRAITATLG